MKFFFTHNMALMSSRKFLKKAEVLSLGYAILYFCIETDIIID